LATMALRIMAGSGTEAASSIGMPNDP
jgi:hypothetical protein